MALSTSLGMSTGTFAPMMSGRNTKEDRSEVIRGSSGIVYKIDLEFHQNIDEREHIKWCRRNLGERSIDWDFWLAGGILYVEVWSDKAKFTYEMWKN
jgi:hypothetical protein